MLRRFDLEWSNHLITRYGLLGAISEPVSDFLTNLRKVQKAPSVKAIYSLHFYFYWGAGYRGAQKSMRQDYDYCSLGFCVVGMFVQG